MVRIGDVRHAMVGIGAVVNQPVDHGEPHGGRLCGCKQQRADSLAVRLSIGGDAEDSPLPDKDVTSCPFVDGILHIAIAEQRRAGLVLVQREKLGPLPEKLRILGDVDPCQIHQFFCIALVVVRILGEDESYEVGRCAGVEGRLRGHQIARHHRIP